MITSSITKDVYIGPCILLIRYYMQIYTSKVWFICLYFGGWKHSFLIKLDDWKYLMLRNEKFPGFEDPYNLFEYFQTKDTDSNSTL